MGSEAFTPGPWHNVDGDIYDNRNDDAPGVPLFRSGLGSFRTWGRELTAAECAANANLIAAAPDLYEALKGALPLVAKWCHTQGDNKQFHDETLAPIRAALAKACPTPATTAEDQS